MENTEYILGLGFTIQLFLNEMSHDDIRKRVEKLTRGFVLTRSIDNFNAGSRDAFRFIEELDTLRKAAIEHAREAKSESDKATEVAEVVKDDRQLELPVPEESEESGESEQS